jgi:hypothetical protein
LVRLLYGEHDLSFFHPFIMPGQQAFSSTSDSLPFPPTPAHHD